LCPRNDANELVKINGLFYFREFLSLKEQEELLKMIRSQPWQQIIARRQQFYGQVYYHTSHKNKRLQPIVTDADTIQRHQQERHEECPISLDITRLLPLLQDKCCPFFGDQGFPSQILVNEYRNTLGIASHFEDFDAFGPVILTISLVAPIYMTLKKPLWRTHDCEDYHDVQKIYLEAGSLLVMQDEARYDYKHGIAKYRWICPPDGGAVMERDLDYRRISITIRHLLQTRRQVHAEQDESEEWKYGDF
jgi:alkylated DNA repair protein alkB family protein 8